MFKVTIDWEHAHKQAHSVEVGVNSLVEKDDGGNVLRIHTLHSLFDKDTYPCPLAKVAAAEQPAGFPPPTVAPCAPGAPAKTELNTYKFNDLLAKLKAEANKNNNHAKLTSMEIHEMLLAMKEH
ncbi:hypothetical protein VPHK436_0018 [Vibrio phage K436]